MECSGLIIVRYRAKKSPVRGGGSSIGYARVSTRNGQTPENQLRVLRTVARRHGWKIVSIYTDDGARDPTNVPAWMIYSKE